NSQVSSFVSFDQFENVEALQDTQGLKSSADKETAEPSVENAETSTDYTVPATQEGTVSLRRDPPLRVQKDHPSEQVIGDINERVTRNSKTSVKELMGVSHYTCYTSLLEPNNAKEALKDECWILAMQEELEQLTRNDVWELVPEPSSGNVIRTKWIFKNKTDEFENVTRNKARLVAQGYTQTQGINFDETFAPVFRLESVRIFLSIACLMKFIVYQMDVKSAFLNGILHEEAYVKQPEGFKDPNNPNHVYRLKKTLYGLKQAPRAWYERLTMYLLEKGFKRGGIDQTFFALRTNEDLLAVQIYVDNIIFGSTSKKLVNPFVKLMSSEFQMSLVGELSYFLGLQVKQGKYGIFLHQANMQKI
ncbi:cysteine-rich RLK (RECEPTOR-like protein kinase) 8, partial [Striga hermonthica]